MALAGLYRVTQDLEGNVVTGVLGTVTLSGTSTLATLYADAAGTLPLPNPTTNNAQYGSFDLFLNAGTYDMQFVKAGYVFETQRNITLRDPAAGVTTITGTANRVVVSPVPGVGVVTLSTPQDIAPDSTVQFATLGLGTPFTGTGRLLLNGGIFSQQIAGSNIAVLASDFLAGGGTSRYFLNHIGDAPSFLGGNVGLHMQPTAFAALSIGQQRVSGAYGLYLKPDTDTGNAAVAFSNTASTIVGSISTNASVTAYNTTSDARLKHAVATLTGELPLIQALRPVAFRWNSDDSPGVGFLAQEVAALVAGVITGELDAVDEEGQILPQQIDYSKLVPWIVGAIQTLVQRLEVVEDAAGI